jgi:hypothetical protein
MSLSEIGHRMISLLHGRQKVIDPRFVRKTVSWILDRDGWLTPVWTTLTNYSDDPNLVRFRNDFQVTLPKSQRPYDVPDLFHYELTAHSFELSDTVLSEIIDYSELARTASKARFDRHPPRFDRGADHGHYGWTRLAWKYQKNKRA